MTSATPVATVTYPELLEAFEFVSSGLQYEHSSYINADTGAIIWISADIEVEEEVPYDIETSDRYIAIPHKNELNLGRNLALAFAEREIPSNYETVVAFFRKKGAYGRFKNFLETRHLLERWHAFEAKATESALRAWCAENDVVLVDAPPSS
jgi:hypothetical protein